MADTATIDAKADAAIAGIQPDTDELPKQKPSKPFDPSKPLARHRWENFVRVYRKVGRVGYLAYQRSINSAMENQNASNQASRLLAKPEIAARLRYLDAQASELDASDNLPPLSRDEVLGGLRALATKGTNTDKLKAMVASAEIQGFDKPAPSKADPLDPAKLATAHQDAEAALQSYLHAKGWLMLRVYDGTTTREFTAPDAVTLLQVVFDALAPAEITTIQRKSLPTNKD